MASLLSVAVPATCWAATAVKRLGPPGSQTGTSIAHRAPTSSGPLSQTGCPAQAESGVESVIEKVTLLSDCGTWTRSTSGVNPSAAKPAALGCCTGRAGYDESGFQRGP